MCAKREERDEKLNLNQSPERLFLAQRRCSVVKNNGSLLLKKVLQISK